MSALTACFTSNPLVRLTAPLLAVALALVPAGARAQTITTSATWAILMDADTQSVLFEKNADQLMSPASLVKIMTAELVFKELKEDRHTLDETFVMSENAWRRGGAPSGGSSMFAPVNSQVRIEDLLRGLIIQSGNDAAIALAEGMAGSEETFAALMTKRARELGLRDSTFKNAWGRFDPEQKVTARDLARLSLHIIKTYPDYYKYFGEPEFTWNKIRQTNRNPLLTMNIGADGLKTGNIEDSGFGLVGSTVENGQRLILVLNGAKTARERAEEARKLLTWGMRGFDHKNIYAAGEPVGAAKVYGGAQGSVDLVSDLPIRVMVPRGSTDRLSGRIVYTGPLIPPVRQGDEVARLKIYRGQVLALDTPLKAAETVDKGTLRQQALDAGLEWFSGLIRKYVFKS
ncbi:D-alanyl-D-alanine carboxypeptidase family protein [Methylocella sp. CPCC 101449]|uniref:D-alanyl-D-alanine carboxypeptidase family protein n=1 Tax=Methylocella sp. CPCC 101449 TaxID=2987531 RepID=UPI00288FCCD5|nr:D-alanyl-D-alanine carboxypeptidase family protein [Methylocella sp. CPCC 101449]MDT2022126.1 D-alanyl-D-alanine carboxypeptidase [Methylocella sp. CPCC 101449]